MKRFCYNSDDKRTDGSRGFSYNRSGPRPRSSSKTAGNENHVGAFEGVLNFVAVFFRGLFSDLRVHPRAKSFRKIAPDMDFAICLVMVKMLGIGIDDDKIHPMNAGVHHAGDRGPARAPYPHNLDTSV